MRSLELDVQPGVISALLFIFLDIFTVGILDIVLARLVCLAYYRNINEGKPVSVKSADIPGLSNYLLGHSLSLINMVALGTKLALLGVVLAANMSIKSDGTRTAFEYRDATFTFEPTDKYSTEKNMVRRRLESSKTCFEEKDDVLTYYSLRFNLQGDKKLEGNDFTDDPDKVESYDVDDSTIICMSPTNVGNPSALAKVVGCTRMPAGECLTVVSREQKKDARGIPKSTDEPFDGEISHMYLDYDKDRVKELWKEYENPVLTCLTTEIGISALNSKASTYSHCLMVSVNNSGKQTYVERWILGPGPKPDEVPEGTFILEYPGIIFENNVSIGRKAAAKYLELPFPFTDYRTLSGDLVAQGSQYKFDATRVHRRIKVDNPVTVIGYWAVGMVAGSIIIVLIGYIVTVVLLRNDSRPRFNTINGLSSIVREEHDPSGRSNFVGESAVLGLRFTNADSLHFGPLTSKDEGTAFQEGYDIS